MHLSDYFLISRDDCDALAPFLFGVAVSESSTLVGGLAFSSSLSSDFSPASYAEGRYSMGYWQGSQFRIRTDPLGQDLIYCYRDASTWAISNSFDALREYLVEKGIATELNRDVAVGCFLDGSWGDQPLSLDTIVKGIRTLALGVELTIDPERQSLTEVEAPKFSSVALDSVDGVQRLSHWLSVWRSMLRSAASSDYPLRVDVSGGRDSRLMLSLLLSSGADTERVRFISNADNVEDFDAASVLAREVGISLNGPRQGTSRGYVDFSEEQAYQTWQRGNLGIYAPAYFFVRRARGPEFHVHGGGGGLHRRLHKITARRLVERWREKSPHRSRELDVLERQLLLGIAQAGKEPGDPDALDAHHRHFRNRFHFGRAWYNGIDRVKLTPLTSATLASIDPRVDGVRDQDLTSATVFLTCAPKVLRAPFDEEEKRFAPSTLKRAQRVARQIELVDYPHEILWAADETEGADSLVLGARMRGRLQKDFMRPEVIEAVAAHFDPTAHGEFSNTTYTGNPAKLTSKLVSLLAIARVLGA